MPRTLLISIHPRFVDLILNGEKRIEFRRSWAKEPVDRIVIYATAPVMRIMAVASIAEVHRESVTGLWELAKEHGGGLTRQELRGYLRGKPQGYGIRLGKVTRLQNPKKPMSMFSTCHIPQSFRYLTDGELDALEWELRNHR